MYNKNVKDDEKKELYYNKEFGLYVNSKGDIFRKIHGEMKQVQEIVNSASGYKILECRGIIVSSARVAFGAYFPEAAETKGNNQIDHINNDKTDNSINNLRLLSIQDNSRNKIKCGGRTVVIHNPITFENKIFKTIIDAARYLNTYETDIIYNLNTKTLVKGYLVRSDSPTRVYKYFIDGVYVGKKAKLVAEKLGVSEAYVQNIFISDTYKDGFIYKGQNITRSSVAQSELAGPQNNDYYKEYYKKNKERLSTYNKKYNQKKRGIKEKIEAEKLQSK